MDSIKDSPAEVTENKESHQENSEIHQKGDSWQRVMKITRSTEKTSKTVQQTRTYKVVGSGDQKQKEVIECKLDTKMANPTTATPPNTPCPSTTENVEATITIKAKPSTTNDVINDEQENGEALNQKDDAEGQIVKKKKSCCSKCNCCSKCVIV